MRTARGVDHARTVDVIPMVFGGNRAHVELRLRAQLRRDRAAGGGIVSTVARREHPRGRTGYGALPRLTP